MLSGDGVYVLEEPSTGDACRLWAYPLHGIDGARRKPVDSFQLMIAERVSECASIEDLAGSLLDFLSSGTIVDEAPDGTFLISFIRAEVARIGGLRIEIRHDEHPPPHFHVVAAGVDASYAIVSGERIAGELRGAHDRKIRYWLQGARPTLIEFWNKTRPTDCPVGPIRIGEPGLPLDAV